MDEKKSANLMKAHDAIRLATDALEKHNMMPTNTFRLDARPNKEDWLIQFIFQPESPDFCMTVRVRPGGETQIMSGY
jgi:hypothetical protein